MIRQCGFKNYWLWIFKYKAVCVKDITLGIVHLEILHLESRMATKPAG